MFVLPLILILAAPDEYPSAGRRAGFVPVAAARELSFSDPGRRVCLQGVVTMETGILRSGPGDFYLQDATGGIVVQGTGSDPVPRAAAVTACGILQLYDDLEPELGRAEVRLIGKGRTPQAQFLSIRQAIDGVSAGQLVVVRGRVQKIAIGETRDAIWVGESGPELRVYLRREKTERPLLAQTAPAGAVVELTGVLIPEEQGKYQIRLRSADDVVLLQPPQQEQLGLLRLWLLAALGAVLAAGLWVILLRRAVRRQTAEIRRLMLEARRSEEAKSLFLANMSHEMRTPLNGILGMAELALESEPDPEQRCYLETIHSSARTLVQIVDDVLDLSRIEKGGLRLEPRPFSLRAMVRELVRLFEPQARRKGLLLQADVQDAVPDLVLGDEGRIRQVLANLLGNAVKFTQAGWVRLESAPEREGRIRFSVADSGPGIPQEKQKSIFQAFVQGDGSSTRQYGGSGLGLTICDRLAVLMGGEIRLESEPGTGSVFSFIVPLPEAPDGEKQDPRSARGQECSRGLSILVAEDDEVSRLALEKLLKRDGHYLRFAADGREAVEKARIDRFDAILMDVQMPVVDGLEATRRIRHAEAAQKRDRVPIIGLTAHPSAENARRCFDAGMDDCLATPCHLEDLRRLLAAYSPRSAARA